MGLFKKPINKKVITIVIVVVVVLAAILGYMAFMRMKKRNTSAASLSFTVSRGNIKSTISGVGTVAVSNSQNLTAPAGSTVSTVNCTEGKAVKSGDTLFTLSDQSAQIDLEKAKLNLAQLQDQLSSLNSELSDLTVYAPVSGIVRSVNVSTGDSITSQGGGQSGLIEIEDTSAMKFSLSSSAAGSDKSVLESLVPGESVQVYFSGKGSKEAKVVSSSYSQQGSSLTFQVLNTKGLGWDDYYTLSSITAGGKSVNIGIPVQVTGSLTNVNAKQSGTVTSVYVSAGSSVSKGSRLIATKSDNITSQIESAQINIESAELDVQNKQSVVDSLTVKAPIDGTIVNIQVQPGDVVGSTSSRTSTTSSTSTQSSSQSSSQSSQSQSIQSASTGAGTTIATIESTSLLQVQVPVDELDIAKVKVGQTATITADAISGKTFTGKVSSIAADGTVQSGSATFQVVIDLDNSDGLKSGMTANVSILTASKDNALLLPVEAIQDRNGRKFVLVKDSSGAITRKEVTLGIVNVDYAEIVSGLNEGDTVIAQIQSSSSSSSSSGNSRSGFSGMGSFGGVNRFGGTGTYSRQSGSYNRQNSQSSSSSNSSGN